MRTTNKGNAGKGRPKGSKNKTTIVLKAAILGALDEVGGQKYLVWLAHKQPQSFCTLLGKVIPTEIVAEVNGTLTTLQASEVVVVHHRITSAPLADAAGRDGAIADAEYATGQAEPTPRPIESVGE